MSKSKLLKSEVVEFFGGPKRTGEAVGITSQAVSHWGEYVPTSRVKAVEMAMEKEASRRQRAEKRKGETEKEQC